MSETVEAKHCYLSHTVGLRRWRVLSSLELHKAAATVIPIAQTIVRHVSRKKKEFQESELVALDWKK